MPAIRRCLLLAAVGVGVSVPSAHAATWTEIPSNTAEDITAVEYQAADRFWFTTGSGKIFRRVGSDFVQEATVPATAFTDIEFQNGGQVGFAVGTNGVVMRSSNGGDTWVQIMGISGGRQTQENVCNGVDQPIGDIDAVEFAGNARAWLVAAGSQIYRTVNGASTTDVGDAGAGWTWINDNGATCRISKDIDDLFAVPASDSVYFVGKSFGTVWFTANALTSAATLKPADAGNGPAGVRDMAGDPANANRQWAVSNSGTGESYNSRTTDGWSTSAGWEIANRSSGNFTRGEEVDANSGTVTAVGSAGMIIESIDGINFYFDPAGGAVATQDWLSVSLASASDAAIGGNGGKLIVSTNANKVPDIVPPTGTIAGPESTTVGQATGFTAAVSDNADGSGVDPNGYTWSATGLPDQTGASASFTFPNEGSYNVKVTFRDLAGNSGEATKNVRVVPVVEPPPPPPLPTFIFPPKSKPPVVGRAARKKGKLVITKVSGKLTPPAGVSALSACTGKVGLKLSKTKGRKRTLASRTVNLSKKCRFKKTLRVRRSKVGKLKRLKLRVAFKGNAAIRASGVTYTIRVK